MLPLFTFIFSCMGLCSILSIRKWGFHVVHTILKYKSYLVHVPWGAPSWFLEHLVDLIIISSYVLLVFRILWLVTSFVEVSFNLFFFCNLWILNIVWSPFQLFVIGYVHLISLILWEMHTLWGSSYYIGLLNFSSHFGNRCQWGRSLEGLREFGFML